MTANSHLRSRVPKDVRKRNRQVVRVALCILAGICFINAALFTWAFAAGHGANIVTKYQRLVQDSKKSGECHRKLVANGKLANTDTSDDWCDSDVETVQIDVALCAMIFFWIAAGLSLWFAFDIGKLANMIFTAVDEDGSKGLPVFRKPDIVQVDNHSEAAEKLVEGDEKQVGEIEHKKSTVVGTMKDNIRRGKKTLSKLSTWILWANTRLMYAIELDDAVVYCLWTVVPEILLYLVFSGVLGQQGALILLAVAVGGVILNMSYAYVTHHLRLKIKVGKDEKGDVKAYITHGPAVLSLWSACVPFIIKAIMMTFVIFAFSTLASDGHEPGYVWYCFWFYVGSCALVWLGFIMWQFIMHVLPPAQLTKEPFYNCRTVVELLLWGERVAFWSAFWWGLVGWSWNARYII